MPKPVSEPPKGEQLRQGVSPEDAAAALRSATKAVQAELKQRSETASGDARAVLEATAMMATDPMLVKNAIKLINAGASAERAAWDAGASVAEMLHNLGGYMAERATDVLDVRARIVAELRGLPAPGIPSSETPFILVAEDLAPADTATLDPAKVLALVTSGGGPQSHTAIIARSLGLPAVVAASGVDELETGALVYVDGAAGTISVDPGAEEEAAAEAYAAAAAALTEFDGTGRTSDGHEVPLLANVGGAKDARGAAEARAQGVGLLRTEFCFLGRDSEPTHDEQVEAYKGVFDAFPGKKVVVRTLDAGADKPLPFLTDTTEPNPALGVRGYRTDLTSPGRTGPAAEGHRRRRGPVLRRGLGDGAHDLHRRGGCRLRGDDHRGGPEEARGDGRGTLGRADERIDPRRGGVRQHRHQRPHPVRHGRRPAARLPRGAEQRLAAGRAAPDWLTVEGSAAEGNAKPVGVCGEAAADPALAVVLVGLGVSTLSMTPRALAGVGAVLNSVSLDEARKLAEIAVKAPSAAEARARVRAELPVLESLGL
jgi:phosphotransferase system enzyme I (PtsI)